MRTLGPGLGDKREGRWEAPCHSFPGTLLVTTRPTQGLHIPPPSHPTSGQGWERCPLPRGPAERNAECRLLSIWSWQNQQSMGDGVGVGRRYVLTPHSENRNPNGSNIQLLQLHSVGDHGVPQWPLGKKGHQHIHSFVTYLLWSALYARCCYRCWGHTANEMACPHGTYILVSGTEN